MVWHNDEAIYVYATFMIQKRKGLNDYWLQVKIFYQWLPLMNSSSIKVEFNMVHEHSKILVVNENK